MRCGKADLCLYAVTDRSWLRGETLYEQVKKALEGGVTFVQLREKELEEEAFLEEAVRIKQLCEGYGARFVINDNVEIAKRTDADGVHVGQDDMEAGAVRARLGTDKIIGVSVHSVEEARRAEAQGADYLGAGAVFSTSSKSDAQSLDHKVLRDICRAVKIPVIAIGGINRDNIALLKGSGICGIAVISAIFAQEDIKGAASELLCRTKRMLEETE